MPRKYQSRRVPRDCGRCGQKFNCQAAYHDHLVGDPPRCATKRELVAMGSFLDHGGRWSETRANAVLPAKQEAR